MIFSDATRKLERTSSASAVASALVLSTLAFTHAGCSKTEQSTPEQNCSGGQSLTKTPLTGASMKLKTLALTFDDGPGMRTVELSAYLKSEGIRAAFFVWGQAVETDGAAGSTLQRLVDDGHLIANHTETHRSLTQNEPTPLTEGEIVDELTKVDGQIAPYVKDNHWLFRPPYGHYTDATQAVLEKTPMNKYVGPILWNVGGTMGANQAADTECWKQATLKTVEECGDLYLKEIDTVGKGIVLLHDPYFIEPNNPESGGTYQMIQYIVPILKTKGYTFIRVDEVPDIAKLFPGAPQGEPEGGAPVDPGQGGPDVNATPLDPCQ